MDAAFSLWLSGVLRGKGDNALTRLNQHALFDVQLLGLIREYASMWHWQVVKSLPIAPDFEYTPFITGHLFHLGFHHQKMITVDTRNWHWSSIKFHFPEPPRSIMAINFCTRHQQWVVMTQKDMDYLGRLEIYSTQGEFIRVLTVLPFPPDDEASTLHLHEPMQCIMVSDGDRHLYTVDWESGETKRFEADLDEVIWWLPHPQIEAVFLQHWELDGSHLSLMRRDKSRVFRVKLHSDWLCPPDLTWMPALNSIVEWPVSNKSKTIRLWSLEGQKQTIPVSQSLAGIRQSIVAHGTSLYCLENSAERKVTVHQLTYAPLSRLTEDDLVDDSHLVQ